LTEIAKDYVDDTHRYFSEVSDLLFGRGKTWAMNAAALGNKRNRQRFIDAFWPIAQPDIEYDFNSRLREKVKKPSRQEWETAKENFNTVFEEAQREYREIEAAYEQLRKLRDARTAAKEIASNILRNKEAVAKLKVALCEQDKAVENMERQCGHLRTKLKDMEGTQSFIRLKKLFTPNTPFMKAYRDLENELFKQVSLLHKARDERFAAETSIDDAQASLQKDGERLVALEDLIAEAECRLEEFRERTGSPLRIDAYFEETTNDMASLSSPWGYEAINRCRARLFIEAMALHKAFVENSRQLRDNLDAFSKMIRGSIPAKQLPIVSPVLLQSFMLTVPVLSTTFASVGSFLRYPAAGDCLSLY